MEIYGIGTDIIEVERIKSVIRKNSGFLKRVYTENEIDYCNRKNKGKFQSFAARFAAKEAVAKSLAEGVSKNISLKEIELSNTDAGAPFIKLYGKTCQFSGKLKIKEIKVSVSATENFAVAYAVAII
ncbi:MAG: holo-[acyl-carrier-protein] synthase [Actinobacteria bacterium RBG_19FT_COMBO_36_27]|nr:holo-ACP synthase [Elusimicrobiota bacterium]OFW62589.1 MAG: holo-[acyl-carrier-protein] synthase [Actinobacteria bacterium RBG_19FT_COMBO_36_27]